MVSKSKGSSYKPEGWHHWEEDFWRSYQFRRGLGETQEGGGTVSEVFQAGEKIRPNDLESWHDAWLIVAQKNDKRGDKEIKAGHVRTAINCWLRAANYYRQAEFWLSRNDPRRLVLFDQCENASRKAFDNLTPKGEFVDIPYEPDKPLPAYFLKSQVGGARQPVLISIGGLDSFKDELWFMTARGALQRGISVLLVDGPGQGGALRRYGLTSRYDYEVPIGKCIDWLETKKEVDKNKIAICGSSLGGHYAARAASMEPRLAACISHGVVWNIYERWKNHDESFGLLEHVKWVFGADSLEEVLQKAKAFNLDGVLENMRCPYLIANGVHDIFGIESMEKARHYAVSKGVDCTSILTTEEDTGAEHCHHDNPTIGQEIMMDWLADVFEIDQCKLAFTA